MQPASAPSPAPCLSRTIRILLAWLRDLLVSVVIAAVLIIFVYQPVKVEGTSMLPALADQERIFVNKFVYRLGLSPIRRGDLVVFRFPGDPKKSYIKRVIGLPGEVVAIERGVVLINGKPLEEDYVPRQFRDFQDMPPLRIGPETYFVLGDHRNSSSDSRNWGLVPRRNIYGKAVFVYWPLDRLGPLR
ncbi:MAG: signal peptidase I [Bryobacteraceae bacterium]